MNKLLITLILLPFVYVCSGQTRLSLTVLDYKTKEPLIYCNVAVVGKNVGGITNSEGKIIIKAEQNDFVAFSHIGYKTKKISVEALEKCGVVYLEQESTLLGEVTVIADKNYLYDVVDKCRAKLLANKNQFLTKAYYAIETESGKTKTPVEFLECYYNATIKGVNIEQLSFKNGRVGLAADSGNYFLSMETSKAIADIELLKNKNNFPLLPLQCNKRNLKNKFDLELRGVISNLFHIGFQPFNSDTSCFSGEIWIEKETYNIVKINFNVVNTRIHPFTTIYPSSNDAIHNLSLDITHRFRLVDDNSVLELINFEYSFEYESIRDSIFFIRDARLYKRGVFSKSTLYFYDINNPFILPYFTYDESISDYQKLSVIPYNTLFWNQDNGMLLSKKQKENLGYFENKGNLINFEKLDARKLYNDSSARETFFEGNYYFWSRDKRVLVTFPDRPDSKFKSNHLQSDLYNLKAQILLDINEYHDSLFCRSLTVFDTPESYYMLPKDSLTDPFINIFFDICEIERQKLQAELDQRQYTIPEIDKIYSETVAQMDKITYEFLREVQRGHKEQAFRRWNEYVLKELGIDNIEMAMETYKEKSN
ncbi:MAG TPA: carboxypeptidase-like regulatory domain-containing protein [Salinivirgaceae bacterium]|nr:carboxypeptidase-like regulatory domain-containing protein [Salinivirgaceae bacterium]